MKKKLLIGGILATVMCASAVIGLTACNDGNKPDKPASTDITEGVYDGTYTGGGFKQTAYLRFHDEGEIFENKQTFYYCAYSGEGASAQDMVKPMLGTYTILDETISLKAWPSGSQRSEDTGGKFESRTADKTVVMYSLDGQTEYFRTGWDTTENKLLGIPLTNADLGVTDTNTMGVPSYYSNYCYKNVKDERTDKGVELYTFYCNTQTVRNASITLYHNKTYVDNKVTGSETVSGTYTVSGTTYTLTAGTGATSGSLVIGNSGATFTPNGGSEIAMTTTRDREALDGYVFTGTGKMPGTDNDVTATITLYNDNSVVVTGFGNPLEGTWDEADGARYITVLGQDIYIEPATDNDGSYMTIELNGITCRTESVSVQVLYTLSGNASGFDQSGNTVPYAYKLVLRSDFSFDLEMNGVMSVASGEWEVLTSGADAGKYQLTVAKTFNNMFAVDSKILVKVTYNSDYTAVQQLEAEIPAVSAMYISAATLKLVVHELKCSAYSGQLKLSLKLYADGKAVYSATGVAEQYGEGTWTADESGNPISAKITETKAGLGEVPFTITESNGTYSTVVAGNTLTTATEE